VKQIILFCLCMFQLQLMAQDKLKVVTTASIFKDMTANIAQDKIELSSIVPVGGDPHLHEPIPRDAQIVQAADLVLINGLTFEGWINELIANSGTKASVHTITEGIVPVSSLVYKDATDPHAWMSAKNGLIYIDNILSALVAADPANSDFYTKNAEAYKSELEALHNYIQVGVNSIPRKNRVLITSHDAFQYYGRAYGLKLEAIMGISTESDAQTSDIIRVNDAIKKYEVPAIFIESTINPAMIKQVAEDNDIIIGGELFADSLGDENSEGATYIKMLRHNTDVIVKALRDGTVAKGHDHHNEKKEGNLLTYLIVGGLLLAGMLLVIWKIK